MDNFSYFHLCNHRIKRNPREGEIMTIVIDNGNDQIDIVMNGAVLLNLFEVRVLEYDPADAEILDFYYDNEARNQSYDDPDPGEAYYDEKEQFIVNFGKYFSPNSVISNPLPTSFYEPMLHNRIRWLVKPPKKYQVKAEVKFTQTSYKTYSNADCPICGGKGWFVDLLSKDGMFDRPRGIAKIAQRVVKDLLTEIHSHPLDFEIGNRLKKDINKYSPDDTELFDMIRMAVSDVEDGYLTNQQYIITQLTDDEILRSIIVEDVFRAPQTPTIIILRIKLITLAEEQTFQIGF